MTSHHSNHQASCHSIPQKRNDGAATSLAESLGGPFVAPFVTRKRGQRGQGLYRLAGSETVVPHHATQRWASRAMLAAMGGPAANRCVAPMAHSRHTRPLRHGQHGLPRIPKVLQSVCPVLRHGTARRNNPRQGLPTIASRERKLYSNQLARGELRTEPTGTTLPNARLA